MTELMLMSNSFSPGQGALEHAMEALAVLFADCRRVLFVPYAGSSPDQYTDAMAEILAHLDIRLAGAHRVPDPLAALDASDAVFVGGGNAFRLLRTVQHTGLLPRMRDAVRAGMPYLGVSAGANLACPTIRTTNDMPVVQPDSFDALGLIPFQVNPHYPEPDAEGGTATGARDARLREFLHDNDVPVLGLCEGSWLRVSGSRAAFGGTRGGRLLRRDAEPMDLSPGDDLSDLMATQPAYDQP